MGSRTLTPVAPATTDELLATLRACRLLDDEQIHRLGNSWDGTDPPGPHLDELIHAGLLTPFQAEHVRHGRTRRLRLGPYRLLDRLGAGGMGQVFKAEHILMKRLVALKLLGRVRPRRRVRPDGSTARVQRTGPPRPHPTVEVETVGRLAHPNIVAAYDAVRLRGRLVLVMEYLDGIDLERLLHETGPLPIPLACAAVRQVAQALDYLHRHGLVHRDVKPANLLLVHEGSATTPRVKLIDLGLACRAGAGGDQLCGTMDYLAPERGMGTDCLDIRSDLYSLGCSLYQLLSGRVPFPGGSWTAKLLRHRLEVPEPIESLRPEVPAALADLVAHLMARDPDDRPASPAAVLAALDHLEAPLALPATPAPPVPRRPRRWALTTVLLAGLTLGAVARVVTPVSPSVENPLAEEPAVPVSASHSSHITVVDQPGTFPDLAAAIAAAPDGGTVFLHGPGPFRTGPVRCRQTLTIRAAGPGRALLERHGGTPWEALLVADHPLHLQGLRLRGDEDVLAPLVCTEGSALTLQDCELETTSAAAAIASRQGHSVVLERCRVLARTQGLAIEVPANRSCQVVVRTSEIRVVEHTGVALLLWASELRPAEVNLTLSQSALHGGRVLACRSVGGPVTVRAPDCQLEARQRRVSFAGYPDAEAHRTVLRWLE